LNEVGGVVVGAELVVLFSQLEADERELFMKGKVTNKGLERVSALFVADELVEVGQQGLQQV
jgi:hypothetical protein